MWDLKRGNKYRAKRTDYGGRQYYSKKEAGRAYELDMIKRAGQIKEVTPQVTIRLKIPCPNKTKGCDGHQLGTYRIDFQVEHNDGTIEYEEVKGMVQPVWKMKWAALEAMMCGKEEVKLTVIR